MNKELEIAYTEIGSDPAEEEAAKESSTADVKAEENTADVAGENTADDVSENTADVAGATTADDVSENTADVACGSTEEVNCEDLRESADEVEEMHREIERLKAELDNVRAEAEAREAQFRRMNSEITEFSGLFPDVKLTGIPQSVWQKVREGVPLAAAYALEERRKAIERKNADAVNRSNSEASSGTLGHSAPNGYFTPSEVRAMSQSEVRANYQKIIESMEHWH